MKQCISTAGNKKQSLYVFDYLPVMFIILSKETFLILSVSPKGKQALLRSNLPAIRLMLIR